MTRLETVLPSLDASGRLVDDLSCRRCGYNLRGLTPEGACPECGAAATDAMASDRLAYADASWVASLAGGMSWVLLAILASFSWGVLVLLGAGMVEAVGGKSAGATAHLIVTELNTPVALAIHGLIIVGVWRTTQRDPDRPASAVGGLPIAQQIARYGLCGGQVTRAVYRVGTFDALVSLAMNGIYLALITVGIVAWLVYLRRLALRLPSETLAKHTVIVLWGGIASFGLFSIGAGIALVSTPSPPGAANSNAGENISIMFGCSGLLSVLVWSLWTLGLLLCYRRDFVDAAMQASSRPIGPRPHGG